MASPNIQAGRKKALVVGRDLAYHTTVVIVVGRSFRQTEHLMPVLLQLQRALQTLCSKNQALTYCDLANLQSEHSSPEKQMGHLTESSQDVCLDHLNIQGLLELQRIEGKHLVHHACVIKEPFVGKELVEVESFFWIDVEKRTRTLIRIALNRDSI